MMYNRYIPDAAGVYHPTQVGAQPQKAAPAPPPEPVCAPPAPPPPPPPTAVTTRIDTPSGTTKVPLAVNSCSPCVAFPPVTLELNTPLVIVSPSPIFTPPSVVALATGKE